MRQPEPLTINHDYHLIKSIVVQLRRNTNSYREALKLIGKLEMQMEYEARYIHDDRWRIEPMDAVKQIQQIVDLENMLNNVEGQRHD